MTANKMLVFLGVMLIWIVSQVSGGCDDSVTKDSPIFIIDSNGNTIGTAKSCSKLVAKWPHMCARTTGDIIIGGRNGRCCQSCKSVDTKCMDTITKNTNFELDGKKIKSCKILVKKYPGLCREEGKKGGRCCQACKGVDLSCVDDPLKLFTAAGLPCDKYIKQDKCRCVEKGDTCCKSCEKVDTDALGCNCRDTLSAEDPATIAITDPTKNNKPVVSKDVDNCKEIVDFFAQFCKDLGGKNGGCCKSCEGVDPNCSDNLLWRGSISHNGQTCNDCTCHDIRRVSTRLMKKACKDNIKSDGGGHRIQTACCLQCSRVGVTA